MILLTLAAAGKSAGVFVTQALCGYHLPWLSTCIRSNSTCREQGTANNHSFMFKTYTDLCWRCHRGAFDMYTRRRVY